jgi:hypothetical protein
VSSHAWLWFRERLARHGVEPEQVEVLEEVLAPGRPGTGGRRSGAERAVLERVQARLGNRAFGQLLQELEERRSSAPPEREHPARVAAAEIDPEEPHDDVGRGFAGPGTSTPERALPAQTAAGASAMSPTELLDVRTQRVLRTLPWGFDESALGALVQAWGGAPAAARELTLRELAAAIVRLPPSSRTRVGETLELRARSAGTDLLHRLLALLASPTVRADAPPPPPDGG